jgi:hypothetical protein
MSRAVVFTGLWIRYVRDSAARRVRLMAFRQPRLFATLAMLAGMLLLGGVAIGWSAAARGVPQADSEDDWQYVLICGECASKTRYHQHPSDVLASQGGVFQCPDCHKFAAFPYRRGSQSIPPGGF